MNTHFTRITIRTCAVVVSLGWASLAIAGKPGGIAHPCTGTVIDAGNSIQSDSPTLSNASYTEGVDGACRLWDFVDFSHLHFGAGGINKKSGVGHFLRLSIPGVIGAGGVGEMCQSGTLKPNQNANRYNFYDLLPIGASTNDINENFGGTFSCLRSGFQPSQTWVVTYPECIVIDHTGVGNWRFTASGGCIAAVTLTFGTSSEPSPIGSFPVPFQVEVDQLDVP
jgi:hypothetical protein